MWRSEWKSSESSDIRHQSDRWKSISLLTPWPSSGRTERDFLRALTQPFNMFRSYSTQKHILLFQDQIYDITFMTIKHISDTILKLNFVQHPKVLIITMLKINFSNSIKFKDLLLPKMNILPLITYPPPPRRSKPVKASFVFGEYPLDANSVRCSVTLRRRIVEWSRSFWGFFVYKRYSCRFITFIFHWKQMDLFWRCPGPWQCNCLAVNGMLSTDFYWTAAQTISNLVH